MSVGGANRNQFRGQTGRTLKSDGAGGLTQAKQTSKTAEVRSSSKKAPVPGQSDAMTQGGAPTEVPSQAMSGVKASTPLHGAFMQVDEAKAAVDRVMDLWKKGEVSESDQVNTHKLTKTNDIELLVDGKDAFDAIFASIEKAEKSINISYYIFEDDETGNKFADLLKAAVDRGVEVNMTIDGIGGVQMPGSPKRKIIDRIEASGVKVIRNHLVDFTRDGGQILNHPDHRKLVIVDGKEAFTGGMNVADHYVDEYHDMMIKVTGPAARQMQAEWLTGWMHQGGRLDRFAKTESEIRERFFPAPKPGDKKAGKTKARVLQAIPGEHAQIFDTYMKMIADAKKEILIENPYCTNPEIQDALIAAAKRGVDVHVVLPGESDHGFSHLAARYKYPKMLDAGVKIYEYPGFNHGKAMVVDGSKATIGSSNLDDVALRHIYELNLEIDDKDFAQDLKKRIFDVDIPKSKPMKASEITTLQRLSGAFFNLFHDVI